MEVEVAWAMVLSSYEIMPFIGSLVLQDSYKVLEHTFNWNHEWSSYCIGSGGCMSNGITIIWDIHGWREDYIQVIRNSYIQECLNTLIGIINTLIDT